MKICLIDAMSVLRVRLENRERQLVRGVINEACQPGRIAIWVWDGAGGNDTRRAIFAGYKTRGPTPSNIHTALNLLRELLTYTPAYSARLKGFEGDDVIAALANHFRGQDVEIHSRDGDLTALGVPVIGATAKVPTHLVRLFKLCRGDPSDTIPGIKGFGQKTWDECDKVGLEKLIVRILARGEWTDEEATLVGLSRASINWLRINADQLGAMYRCIQPLPIQPEVLSAAVKQGTDDPAKREALMSRFMF